MNRSYQDLLNEAVVSGKSPSAINRIRSEMFRRGIPIDYMETALYALRLGKLDELKSFLRELGSHLTFRFLTKLAGLSGKGSRYNFEYLIHEFPGYIDNLIIKLLPEYTKSFLIKSRINYLLGLPRVDIELILSSAVLFDNEEVIKYILDHELLDELVDSKMGHLLFQAVKECKPKSVRIILDYYHVSAETLQNLIDFLTKQPESEDCDEMIYMLEKSLGERNLRVLENKSSVTT